MKIALSVEALSPNLTGIGRYTLEIARRLSPSASGDDLFLYRNGAWARNPDEFIEDIPAIKRSRVQAPRWWKKRQSAWNMRGRLFHGPNYFLPAFVDGGVITVHDLSVIHFPETHPIDRIRYFEREFASSLERSAHIITDSETVRQELVAYTGLPASHITAVPLGVSTAFGNATLEAVKAVAGRYALVPGQYGFCVSTIEPRKKIEQLVLAWQALPENITRQFPLAIVGGGGWLSENIKSEMEKGTRNGWLAYLGYVPEADLPALYQGSALFVYPSSYEGFGLPPIEAMASGVPTIVSNRSCLPEVTKGAAMVIDPDDIDRFAEALQRGLTDEVWRAQAINHGREVAAGYSWDRCALQTRDVYRHVLARN